jgi:hypothetical protein
MTTAQLEVTAEGRAVCEGEGVMIAPVTSLADYRAARQATEEPLEPGPSDYPATVARLREDYYLADAASGDDWLAHLWAMQSTLDEIAAADDPRTEVRYLAAALMAELTRAMGKRGAKR